MAIFHFVIVCSYFLFCFVCEYCERASKYIRSVNVV